MLLVAGTTQQKMQLHHQGPQRQGSWLNRAPSPICKVIQIFITVCMLRQCAAFESRNQFEQEVTKVFAEVNQSSLKPQEVGYTLTGNHDVQGRLCVPVISFYRNCLMSCSSYYKSILFMNKSVCNDTLFVEREISERLTSHACMIYLQQRAECSVKTKVLW